MRYDLEKATVWRHECHPNWSIVKSAAKPLVRQPQRSLDPPSHGEFDGELLVGAAQLRRALRDADLKVVRSCLASSSA